MRPLFLSHSSHDETPKRPWRFWSGISVIALGLSWGIASFAGPQSDLTPDPMEDKYSKTIRAEYAKCREEKNPMSQYFCTCRVLEKQCEVPRRLEHGNWYTVEFWPSNDEAEREVQFILMMEYDVLGDFTPIDKGIVLTCMTGLSDINIFVGEHVNPDVKPHVTIGTDTFKGSFVQEGEAYILGFENNAKLYGAIGKGSEMLVTYTDMEETERKLEFDTYGFDNVSKGWEKLCTSPTS